MDKPPKISAERLIQAVESRAAAPNDILGPALQILHERAPAVWAAAVLGQAPTNPRSVVQMFSDALGCFVLANCIIPKPSAELLLTTARRWLLLQAFEGQLPPNNQILRFAVALAEQCFLNEYCFWVEPDETVALDIVTENIRTAVAEGEPVDAVQAAVAACYRDLPSFGDKVVAALAKRQEFAVLYQKSVLNRAAERELASRIPRLTPITDAMSQAVRAMYEENPYPRWEKAARRDGVPFAQGVKSMFPAVDGKLLGNPGSPRALLAGCGTGQHVAHFFSLFSGVDVTAIDLSLASLSYAKRTTDALGLKVRYGQADILEIDKWDEQFDLVECLGTLMTLNDPMVGWRNLVACVRPGGVMRIGLYNFAGRKPVRDAWRLIKEQGFKATPEGIRKFRRSVLNTAWTRSTIRPPVADLPEYFDFYTTSMCRDLTFHVREIQHSIAEVVETASSLGLTFIGMSFSHASKYKLYTARHPQDPYACMPDHLKAFEKEHPEAFRTLMIFGLQKQGA